MRWKALAGFAALALIVGVWFARDRAANSDAVAPHDRPAATIETTSPLGTVRDEQLAPPVGEQRSVVPVVAEEKLEAPSIELAGVLVDKSTAQPLFDFELGAMLKLEGWITLPNVRTDAEGRFSFGELDADARATKEIRLSLVDDPSIQRRNASNRHTLKRESTDTPFALPARVEVEVGPSLGFDVQFPDELTAADFRVRHQPGPPRLESDTHHPSETDLRTPLDFGPHAGRPWVRFGDSIPRTDRVWVEMRSREPLWRGGAWLTQVNGVVANPLVIRLEQATRLIGRFTFPSEVEEKWVQLRLSPLRDEEPHGRPMRGHGNAKGFAFEFLRPGRYRLWTWDPAWQPFELDIDVLPGENDIGEFPLTPRPIVGSLSGIIRSTSGEFEGACHVSLSDRAMSHDAAFDHSLDFEPVDENDETSELVAHFEFDRVTAGDWWLYVHCHDGFEFPESVRRVRAPAENIEIVLDDPAMTVRVEIVAAEDGTPCEDASFAWNCGDQSDREDGSKVKIGFLPDAPDRFAWIAYAPGRRFARGTGANFERVETANGGRELVGRIALERGFGRRIVAVYGADGTALAGVEVRCDGELAGVTGVDGAFDLVRDVGPTRITLSKSGWVHMTSNDFNTRDGVYSDDGELRAYFEPESP